MFQIVDQKWGGFGNVGTDGVPVRGAPDENRLTASRAGEMGVQWLPFSSPKREFRLSCSATCSSPKDEHWFATLTERQFRGARIAAPPSWELLSAAI
jgi:hypothetical protein